MKKPETPTKHVFFQINQAVSFFIATFFVVLNATSQNLVNNGAHIVVKEGANVVIGGNYINKNDGASDGKINLDGNIYLRRNWVNNANNDVLMYSGADIRGKVIMDGTVKQFIEGTHSSAFENLIIRNAKKILNVSGCSVRDTLTIDAILQLNAHNIKILNSNPHSITYQSGYILSETNTYEGLGYVDWYIGSDINFYQIPFGSGNDNGADLRIDFRTLTAALPSTGYVRFATYPTPCQNVPLPPNVNELDRSYEYIADRFWMIEPHYTSKPAIEMSLGYTSYDVNNPCNGGLHETEMKAIRYNTLQHTWSDMPACGTASEEQKRFYTGIINESDFYAPWCLVQEVVDWEIFIPNAFTPNGDGKNEYFAPIGLNLEKLDLKMYIYNRWGNLVYEMDGIENPWDGRYGNSDKICPEGVYTWIMFLKDQNGMERKYKGIVTLVK